MKLVFFTKIIRCYKAILPKHNIHIIADEFNAHLVHQHELKCLHVQLIINRIRINEYLQENNLIYINKIYQKRRGIYGQTLRKVEAIFK